MKKLPLEVKISFGILSLVFLYLFLWIPVAMFCLCIIAAVGIAFSIIAVWFDDNFPQK